MCVFTIRNNKKRRYLILNFVGKNLILIKCIFTYSIFFVLWVSIDTVSLRQMINWGTTWGNYCFSFMVYFIWCYWTFELYMHTPLGSFLYFLLLLFVVWNSLYDTWLIYALMLNKGYFFKFCYAWWMILLVVLHEWSRWVTFPWRARPLI